MTPFIDALLNSAAVWFALKAVEVLPIAIYDIVRVIQDRVRREQDPDTLENTSYGNRYDSKRGKLEYVVSGEGFVNYRLFRKSKIWFLISTLVPLLIFALELMSILLGNQTRICETSTDMNVVSAPGLQLFGKGKRETPVEDLNNRLVSEGRSSRLCVTKQSTVSGVEYLASVCSEMLSTSVLPRIIISQLLPNHKWISIVIHNNLETGLLFSLIVFSKTSRTSFVNSTAVGAFVVCSEVLVNGKSFLRNDVIKDGVINENMRQQIRDDVRTLEEAKNVTFSEYLESEELFLFQWDSLEDYTRGSPIVGTAVIAQSTSTEIRTAAEMSKTNLVGVQRSFDISCRGDFVLSTKLSIVIIVMAVLFRMLLLTVPSSVSSAEFALSVAAAGTEEVRESSTFFMDRKGIISELK